MFVGCGFSLLQIPVLKLLLALMDNTHLGWKLDENGILSKMIPCIVLKPSIWNRHLIKPDTLWLNLVSLARLVDSDA